MAVGIVQSEKRKRQQEKREESKNRRGIIMERDGGKYQRLAKKIQNICCRAHKEKETKTRNGRWALDSRFRLCFLFFFLTLQRVAFACVVVVCFRGAAAAAVGRAGSPGASSHACTRARPWLSASAAAWRAAARQVPASVRGARRGRSGCPRTSRSAWSNLLLLLLPPPRSPAFTRHALPATGALLGPGWPPRPCSPPAWSGSGG